MSFGGKNFKRGREKGGKCKTKGRKRKEKRQRRKKKISSKRENKCKIWNNYVRQIEYDRSRKTACCKRGKNIIFGNGRE
jgi:hypothetical protein